MQIRRGLPSDVPALDAIAYAAKAHWGYSQHQLDAWRDDLAVEPDSLDVRPVFVAEDEIGPVGFVQVAIDPAAPELWALWVHPRRIGQGIGTALLSEARAFASAAGCAELAIDADPNAEGFYVRCGAAVVARLPAPIGGQPRRTRPQLVLALGVG